MVLCPTMDKYIGILETLPPTGTIEAVSPVPIGAHARTCSLPCPGLQAPFFKDSNAKGLDGIYPGSIGWGAQFSSTKISRRLPWAASKRNVAPAASSAITKWAKHPTEHGDGTLAPIKERCIVQSKRTLRGVWRRGLVEAAPVPKNGSCRDTSGAHPNWAASFASPGKTTSRSLAG